ncbi:hypothetical protein F5B20DRAFT_166805 [Whalleya microplaca]|nr:hypothetical protein F5B20DRAFT_166805 [Whalleya microplaca]
MPSMKGLYMPFVLLLVLGCLGGIANGARHLATRGADNPGPDTFIRYQFPSVVVLGDYAYIDGGEIFSRVNGTGSEASTSAHTVSTTLSLGLNQSWTNETVALRSIPKAAPLLSRQIYWINHGIKTFYTWGGMASGSASPPANELWRFAADGSGGGQWFQVPQGDYLDFSRLVRPVGAAFTQSADVGYALGGEVTSKTDTSIQKDDPGYALPGLVSYNFETGQWKNTSSAEYQGYGTSLNARAEYVPFGPNGLLLFLGGAEAPVDAEAGNVDQISWDTLTLHDPVTGKWYTQATTGTRPPTVERACSVGINGPNNTYEIFMYGGVSDHTGNASSEVYVLSLPGFVFFKSTSDGTPRRDHDCAVVGKRQMLSVGGTDGGRDSNSSAASPDPWKQGLGIFDMSKMEWTKSYDSGAADYESPAVLDEWYRRGGMDFVSWKSDEVKRLFINGTSTTYGGGRNSPTSNPSDGTQQSTLPTGAIVGSTVGGVLVLTSAGVIIFSMLRRRKRRRHRPRNTIDSTIEEYRPEPWPKSDPWRSPTPGAMSSPTPVEIDDTTPVEMYTRHAGMNITRAELDITPVEIDSKPVG